jgi:hypothetical protein
VEGSDLTHFLPLGSVLCLSDPLRRSRSTEPTARPVLLSPSAGFCIALVRPAGTTEAACRFARPSPPPSVSAMASWWGGVAALSTSVRRLRRAERESAACSLVPISAAASRVIHSGSSVLVPSARQTTRKISWSCRTVRMTSACAPLSGWKG